MNSIYHQVGIEAAKERVHAAITQPGELAAWWTRETEGESRVGGTLQFRFEGAGFDMLVLANEPNRVEWRCSEGFDEWLGTEIRFDLREEGGQVFVDFTHSHWQEISAHFRQCSTKWAVFLLSLKEYLEHGRGRPFPDDVPINHS
jgi:uncharacterized protein YndB with AHSA1/START domain